uniref:BNIP3 n=2 Tax=Acrobeloides nanus TaxID=290746 RepID=A0A914DU10_9BILA
MFDVTKRLGTAASSERATDEDSMPESWVELAPSRTSLCSSVEAVMVDKDGGEASSNSKDSRLSPVSLQSPHVEFETNLEQVKSRLVKDMLPPGKNTDWIWDWSSRPEAAPPKGLRHRSGQQVGSTLTTPPNSPEPELSSEFEYKYRREKNPKKPVFLRFEVIFGLVVSNLMTFVLGATLGFYICKRLIKNEDSQVEFIRWDQIKW